jgi:hypothetical protein
MPNAYTARLLTSDSYLLPASGGRSELHKTCRAPNKEAFSRLITVEEFLSFLFADEI